MQTTLAQLSYWISDYKLSLMDYVFPHVGVHRISSHEWRFTVWAPQKDKLELIIDGGKPLPMTRDDFGYWTVTSISASAGSHYHYRIDSEKVLPDPASRWQPDGVHGASAIPDPDFIWSDSGWKGLHLRELIVYELHVGTFTSEGTFNGVASRLDYLQDLGVNAIELMPVAQFPGSRNWGYDGVFPYAVQHSYGGPLALKSLVNEAHARGIAVILDVVYNHQGPEGNYLGEFAPYFTDKYHTFWGSAINFDDAWSDGVRQYYIQNALMWLDEFQLDGLRLDAVHAIRDFGASHFIHELTDAVDLLQERTGRKKNLIAELDLNDPKYVRPKKSGGYGMSGQWVDEFHHALHSLVTGERDGYYEDFGSPHHLAKALQSSYVYTGEYSIHRKRKFGLSPGGLSYGHFVVFAQNHDQVGNRMLGNRLTTMLDFEPLKLIAAAMLLAPQVPMLFMGEEYGETNPFQYFISHTDEKLVDMVRKGRKEEFSYFKWEGEVPDPQSESVFNQCVLSWNYHTNSSQTALFRLYKHLINLRKTSDALHSRELDHMRVFDPGARKVIAFERRGEQLVVLVILNFENSSITFDIPGEIAFAEKAFDTSALQWRGPGELSPMSVTAGQKILLHKQSAVVYQFAV
jgi:maltooligosyltrehalose trehalohydrolase